MTSTSIYSKFKPTYLYIKQHSITGKFYFGKTTYSDPTKYLGSGVVWRRHIRAHGKQHVVTLWYELFTSKEDLVEFATSFSTAMNIVESDQWANLIDENGLDGGATWTGLTRSAETKHKISVSTKGRQHTPEHRTKISIANSGHNHGMFGKYHTAETKQKISISAKKHAKPNEPKCTIICPHCGCSGGAPIMKRWHFDRCRSLTD